MVGGRTVTLFKVSKSSVTAFNDIKLMMYNERPTRSYNSKDIFIENELLTQYNAKVYRIYDSLNPERFIAFDRDLENIFEVFNREAYQEGHRKGLDEGRMNIVDQVWELKDEIKRLQSRTIWSMIADKFKRSK